jgi:hypothetical protein
MEVWIRNTKKDGTFEDVKFMLSDQYRVLICIHDVPILNQLKGSPREACNIGDATGWNVWHLKFGYSKRCSDAHRQLNNRGTFFKKKKKSALTNKRLKLVPKRKGQLSNRYIVLDPISFFDFFYYSRAKQNWKKKVSSSTLFCEDKRPLDLGYMGKQSRSKSYVCISSCTVLNQRSLMVFWRGVISLLAN